MTALPTRQARGGPIRRFTGLVEALLTPHGADRYLELLDPMLVRREVRGEVTAVHRQTADTVTLTVRPSRAWQGFRAGQYVRVSVEIDGVWRTRCYSPANSQHRTDGLLELTVKAAPDGLVSGHLREKATPGTVLRLSQPDGSFTLPDPRPHAIVLISGGSGITPVLAMLRTLRDEGYAGKLAVLHYANDAADVLYRDEFAAETTLAYTLAESGADVHGFFTPEHLTRAAPWFREAQTYLCGPTPLMDSVRATYADNGIGERLHTEEFTPPALTLDTANAHGTVRFTRSGAETANSGHPLLEQAEAAGLSPEHGCRMGICFSCTKVKACGRTRDVRSGEESAEENVEIQLCVNVPVGDVEIEA